jgi:hypothetical protein
MRRKMSTRISDYIQLCAIYMNLRNQLIKMFKYRYWTQREWFENPAAVRPVGNQPTRARQLSKNRGPETEIHKNHPIPRTCWFVAKCWKKKLVFFLTKRVRQYYNTRLTWHVYTLVYLSYHTYALVMRSKLCTAGVWRGDRSFWKSRLTGTPYLPRWRRNIKTDT